MEPIPEVSAAAALGELLPGADLLEGLRVMAGIAEILVPSSVGVSLTVIVDGQSYTLTATSPTMTALDAVQYLDGGPCVDAALHGRQVDVDDVLDEGRWQLFEQAANSSGVRSSLSLPVGRSDAGAPAALNIYASEPDAFAGRSEALARAFGTSGDAMVSNADLSFRTRDAARGWSAADARDRLLRASSRAGAQVEHVVSIVLTIHTD